MKKAKDLIYREALNSDGLITTKEIEELGIGRYNIKHYIDEGFLVRESQGIYSIYDAIPDEYVTIQKRSEKAVYSFGTALFFHGYSDRVPGKIDITLPQGYNASRIKKTELSLRFHYVKPEILDLGATSIRTPQGSLVKAYNIERCICDLIKNKNKVDKQLFIHAIKTYFSGSYDVRSVIRIAKIIGVEKEVRAYMEVL